MSNDYDETVRPLDTMLEKERFHQQMRDAAATSPSTMGYGHLGKAVPPQYAGSDMTSVPSQGPASAYPFMTERLSLSNIDDAMKYQPWTREQSEAGEIVREVLAAAAKAILRSVPDGAYRSVALRNIIDARMNANAAISFRGRF